MARRKGQQRPSEGAKEQRMNSMRNVDDLLFAMPERLKNRQSAKNEEMLSNQMLCGIPEVDLGVEWAIPRIFHLVRRTRKFARGPRSGTSRRPRRPSWSCSRRRWRSRRTWPRSWRRARTWPRTCPSPTCSTASVRSMGLSLLWPLAVITRVGRQNRRNDADRLGERSRPTAPQAAQDGPGARGGRRHAQVGRRARPHRGASGRPAQTPQLICARFFLFSGHCK